MTDEKSIELKKDNPSIAKIDAIDKFSSFSELELFFDKVKGTGLIPSSIDTVGKFVATVQLGKELGMGVMGSLANIYSVNGRSSVGVHIINAKLDQYGIKTTVLKDYEPVYIYKDNTGIDYKEDFILNNLDKYQLITTETKKEKFDNNRTQILRQIVDYGTEIKFERKVKDAEGKWYLKEYISKFSWQDAVTAGLSTKDNWIKNPKVMIRTRCLTIGARWIASDALLGMLEHSELADVNNLQVREEEGEFTIIESNETKSI
ncbi:MAG: hypothetical protein JST04_00860 [Bdellovibrionales bacterium]|nr:hypothetical protein [Bdellovibrionales bacterium]